MWLRTMSRGNSRGECHNRMVMLHHKRRARLLLAGAFSICLLFSSCSRTETPVAPAQDDARAALDKLSGERDALLKEKTSMQMVASKWTLDEEINSTFTAYYQGETLRLIEEQMAMGKFGSAQSTYFYSPQGGLFAYTESKDSQRGAQTGNPVSEKVEMQLLFGPNGAALGGERRVDGKPAELTGVEFEGVKMHSRELQAVLTEKRAAAGK